MNRRPLRNVTASRPSTSSQPTTGYLAVDIGGTKLAAGVVAPDGSVLIRDRVPTPARAFNSDVIAGVEAVDETTVRITTPKPDALVPLRVANANAGILAPKAYEGRQIDIVGTCTGPFTVTEEVPAQSLSLEANEDYWGGDVTLDSAEVRFIVDGAARATQLQSGEVNIAKSLPVANLATLEGDDNLSIVQLELARTTVMLLILVAFIAGGAIAAWVAKTYLMKPAGALPREVPVAQPRGA